MTRVGEHAGCEQVEHVGDPNPHAPDARSSAALVRVHGDALQQLDGPTHDPQLA
jgi:hypothetical protein